MEGRGWLRGLAVRKVVAAEQQVAKSGVFVVSVSVSGAVVFVSVAVVPVPGALGAVGVGVVLASEGRLPRQEVVLVGVVAEVVAAAGVFEHPEEVAEQAAELAEQVLRVESQRQVQLQELVVQALKVEREFEAAG